MKEKLPYGKVALGAFLMLFLVASGSKTYVLLFAQLEARGFSMGFVSFCALLTTAAVFASGLLLNQVLQRLSLSQVMVLGGILMAAAYGLLAWAANPLVLVLAVVLMGVATTFSGYTPVSMLMQRWFSGGYGMALSIVFTGMTFGASFYAFLYGKLIGTAGYAGTLGILAVFPLVLPFFVSRFLIRESPGEAGLLPYAGRDREKNRPAPERLELPTAKARRTALFWYVLGITFFLGGTVATVQSFIPAYLEGKGFTAEQAATVYSFMMLLGAPATLLGGFLADRFSPRTFLLVTCLAFLGGMGILLTVQSAYGVLFVMALLFGVAFPSGSLTPSLLLNDSFGTDAYNGLLSVVQATSFISIGILFMAAGAVRDAVGSYEPVFLGLLVIGAAATAAVALYPSVKKLSLLRHPSAS